MRCVLWWHLHQPDYRHPGGDTAGLPWVRMHALRAYTDLVEVALREGLGGMTVNVVPSLADQLEDAATGRVRDDYWTLGQRVAEGDEEAVAEAFARHAVPTPVALHPLPRFEGLREAARAGHRPSLADARDAVALFHLAWVGFTASRDPRVAELARRGRDFSGEDVQALLDLSLTLSGDVLPRIRRAREQGLVHLTTTPYFHPILPLVIDGESAREATQDGLPAAAFARPDDARAHVERAVARHEELFGEPPRAMWPGEGSLSEAAAHILTGAGVEVAASDQTLLHKSLGEAPGDAHLYPWRHEPSGLSLLFRDRALSDDWGFVYRELPADEAIGAFTRGVHARSGKGRVTSVILDGENPFERFADAGEAHLTSLARAVERGHLALIAPEEAAADSPRPLPHLATGSWIDASFEIWAGDDEDRRAWALLARTRELVDEVIADAAPDDAERALYHLLAAEGSDWFWWFGPEFHAEEQPAFDRLFREHLQAALRAAGRSVYDLPELRFPVRRERATTSERTAYAAGEPQTDARYPESLAPWANARTAIAQGARGTMHRGAPVVRELRALAGASQLHLLALCRDDVQEVAFVLQTPAGERVRSAPARDLHRGDRLARLRVEWSVLDAEPGARILVRATAHADGAQETLPEPEDEALLLERPPLGWWEA